MSLAGSGRDPVPWSVEDARYSRAKRRRDPGSRGFRELRGTALFEPR